jgi:hypothetical protein
MIATGTMPANERVAGPSGSELVAAQVHKWSAMCGEFLAWEREHVLLAEPTQKAREEHRQSLKWLLLLTRVLHSMVLDPDFPDRSLASELHGRLLQLECSWKMIFEAMPEPEAVKLLKENFTSEADQRFIARLFPEFA